jgi:hypothetical protein
MSLGFLAAVLFLVTDTVAEAPWGDVRYLGEWPLRATTCSVLMVMAWTVNVVFRGRRGKFSPLDVAVLGLALATLISFVGLLSAGSPPSDGRTGSWLVFWREWPF